MSTFKNRLKKAVSAIEGNDGELAEELRALRTSKDFQKQALEAAVQFESFNMTVSEVMAPASLRSELALETIVLKVGRPVLTISNDEAILQFRDTESQVWKDRLQSARQQLISATRAVGRIELQNDPSYEWIGTGWLVDESIVVTNRHVAQVFGRKNGAAFVFRQGSGGQKVGASIDFLEEADRPDELTFKIVGILHIEDQDGPDMALLRVELSDKKLSGPISLSAQLPAVDQQVAVIGYPARDSRIPDQQLMIDIFGDVYDKKRLAPGRITRSSANELLHDCSTLGGNSGSVVLDLESGRAVGLHFAGRFLESNFAVPASLIKDRVERFKSNSVHTVASDAKTATTTASKKEVTSVRTSPPGTMVSNQAVSTFVVPIHLTISVDASVAGEITGTSIPVNHVPPVLQNKEQGEEFITEGVPEDYDDRQGYDAGFLGTRRTVPLPVITDESLKQDVLTFNIHGQEEEVLKYRHFSVVMSESRRLCFFSAVNIDGKTSMPMKRGPWRLDPRIPQDAQIMKECYGLAPKFSRGHMTRREDPIWGGNEDATQGNADSMHVTNTVPQMQDMNAGIWLRLENYALQNARKDDMRISVFTGPVFSPGDPVRFGVPIPLAFWKVIAFIHDKSRKLCATGYRISQESFLQGDEFVFGAHSTAQVSIASIEQETSLSFGELSALDPFEGITEMSSPVLKDLGEIKFI